MTKKQQKEMSDRIKARRSSLGFTQEQFAEVLEIGYSSYVRIENAFQKPALDTLIKIAQRLELSLDYLVFGTDERKPAAVADADALKAMLAFANKDMLLHASDFLSRAAKIKGQQ